MHTELNYINIVLKMQEKLENQGFLRCSPLIKCGSVILFLYLHLAGAKYV